MVVRLARGPATEHRLGGYDFFRPGDWSVVFADYDRDGRIDFNLGRYAGCNGWRYDLFTVDASGRVRRLLTTRPLAVADHSNSTARIRTPAGSPADAERPPRRPRTAARSPRRRPPAAPSPQWPPAWPSPPCAPPGCPPPA